MTIHDITPIRSTLTPAKQIIRLHEILGQSLPEPARIRITREQRRIWDASYPDLPFEEIRRLSNLESPDEWLVRKP